ncbi:hypothetical protein IQ249_11805 [Lusitaniella coriacea LEGE 07157]|uniref:Uncharacterized protein n=1 Tax=Lusitaniella coriacea LEGE 07157 TaxID=945747 RepID=A0A8J7DX65_9CYAN|nr:hypothetical protein [Lusitaniella coriacea]MBE9116585.1 hypothetical protein [Lusitaniella coriacea LEGE 07157]
MKNAKDSQISQKLREELSQFQWLRALSLPVLPWVKPFLPLLDIPQLVQDNSSLWEEIYLQNLAALKVISESPEPITREELETIYPLGILQAMHQLAEQGGVAVALELERWVRRYFRPHESHTPLCHWHSVLRLTFLLQRHDRIPPPAVLEPLVPDIEKLYRNFEEARYEIFDIAPPNPLGGKSSRCMEVTLMSQARRNTFPVRVLRKIAQELNPVERQEVINWAERQVKVMFPPIDRDPSVLCGERYMRVEPPGFDMPSILGFSDEIDRAHPDSQQLR